MRWPVHPLQALAEARGTLFPFAPVLLGCGIGLWFALHSEPPPLSYLSLGAALALAAALGLRGPEALRIPALALACLLAGPLLAGARAHLVAAPVLEGRYYGPVEGRVTGIDRSQGDDLRLTLDRVVLDGIPPEATPRRLRVALHGASAAQPPPGATVILTAHLGPPPGPSEPGGFDFRRMAFFEQLGAVGYTRTPVLLLAPPAPGEQRINRLRAALSAAILAQIPGQAGAFAAGAVTGDRSAITQETVAALRDSNLSHLLAISGMNMAFITAFVFALVRYGLALVPPLALRCPTKKVAAVVALAVAAFYLALSGANVATERAFVMVAVMLIAVLADRRALSLRAVAIAALILLALRPESLLSPGFQMSFAATVVLIAGFARLDRALLAERLPGWTMPVVALVLSSVLAGLATAPLAAAHFNRFTDYGLIANLLTVPAMGLLIMPGAVLAALLWPLGLQVVGMTMMGLGASWILAVAHWVAGWDGSVTGIPTPGPAVLPILALGALWLILWRGSARWAGVAPMLVALVLWATGGRPDLLASADGAQVGLVGPEGRALSAPRGAGFATRSWLENDGDLADPQTAAARPGFEGPPGARSFALAGLTGIHLKGRGAADRAAAACATHDIVILSVAAPGPTGPCLMIDAARLAATGTLALRDVGGELRLTPTQRATRLWSPRPAGPDDLPRRLALRGQ